MATKKTRNKGKRYTPGERQEVLNFVDEHNTHYGRGGMTTAVKKFGISAVTIRNWITDMHSDSDTDVTPTDEGDVYRGIAKLVDEISDLQNTIDNKKAQLDDLRSQIL